MRSGLAAVLMFGLAIILTVVGSNVWPRPVDRRDKDRAELRSANKQLKAALHARQKDQAAAEENIDHWRTEAMYAGAMDHLLRVHHLHHNRLAGVDSVLARETVYLTFRDHHGRVVPGGRRLLWAEAMKFQDRHPKADMGPEIVTRELITVHERRVVYRTRPFQINAATYNPFEYAAHVDSLRWARQKSQIRGL